MIRSPSRNMPDIRSFVEQIDNAAAKLNTEHVHVVPLKNADATKLAKTLQTVIAGIPVKELQTGVVYPDVSSNSLLIAAPPSVYQQLARVIAVLDTPRSQIYVESLIAEVNADDGEGNRNPMARPYWQSWRCNDWFNGHEFRIRW